MAPCLHQIYIAPQVTCGTDLAARIVILASPTLLALWLAMRRAQRSYSAN
jgi:hypothetical protein